MTGTHDDSINHSPALKENEPNIISAKHPSSCKKRKIDCINVKKHSDDNNTTMVCQHDNRPSNTTEAAATTTVEPPTHWEKLFRDLQAERVTKAEAMLHAYMRESEEREQLMRTYNQELENENQKLKVEVSNVATQKQTIQDLENRIKESEPIIATQEATIQAFQQLTGVTLSNVQVQKSLEEDNVSMNGQLDCDCTVENQESKVRTKFRISTASTTIDAKQCIASTEGTEPPKEVILKYQPLENPSPLPAFLHEEIEFESSQLPPLLQNILRGIFPDE